LELGLKGSRGQHSSRGFITIQLSAGDATQMGSLAISNARQDIERHEIGQSPAVFQFEPVQPMGAAGSNVSQQQQQGDFGTALWNIVSKLELFIAIMDRTSKVSAHELYIYLTLTI
jgi:hypothetical protein